MFYFEPSLIQPGPSIPAIMEILGKIPVLQRLYRTIEAITD